MSEKDETGRLVRCRRCLHVAAHLTQNIAGTHWQCGGIIEAHPIDLTTEDGMREALVYDPKMHAAFEYGRARGRADGKAEVLGELIDYIRDVLLPLADRREISASTACLRIFSRYDLIRAQQQPAPAGAEFVACGRCSCTTVPTTRYFMCEECARAGWPTRAEHEQQVREAVLREREACVEIALAHEAVWGKTGHAYISDKIRARTAQGEGTPE